jgi:hypothetical protein
LSALLQTDAARLTDVWRQNRIPVLLRKGRGHKLMVKVPYADDNHAWLRNDRRARPNWNGQYKCWELPQAWFNDLVTRILARHSQLYIIQPYREQEVCAPACWNAEGHECQCACMGENHGSQRPGGNWFIVSETFATLWHDRELACRLMARRD